MLCCAVCSCSAPAGYCGTASTPAPKCSRAAATTGPSVLYVASALQLMVLLSLLLLVWRLCRSEVDPEQAVALGAAIQAAVLLGLSSGVELMDGSYVEEFHNRSTGF